VPGIASVRGSDRIAARRGGAEADGADLRAAARRTPLAADGSAADLERDRHGRRADARPVAVHELMAPTLTLGGVQLTVVAVVSRAVLTTA
jgi:hypothetical protein